MIKFKCKKCGKLYSVKDNYGGKRTKCKECGAIFVIPSPPTVLAPVQSTPAPAPASTIAQPPPPEHLQPQPQVPQAQLNVSVSQPGKTGKDGFFRAFGITSGFMAAILMVLLGLPILACGGCMGLAFLVAPSEEQMQQIREESAARREKLEGEMRGETDIPEMNIGNYRRLQMGMTYSEVVAIVGKPSKELSSSSLGGVTTVMYQWDSGFMGNAQLMFQDGELVSKAEFGL